MPADPPAPLADGDWSVLSRLEDLEQDLINFGIYETYVSPEEVAARPRTPDGGGVADLDVRAALERLCAHFLAVRLPDNRYRSRISEIVRLLKNVKQRFGPDDAGIAPFLVQSIRVRFQDRRRLHRSESARTAFQRLFQENRLAPGTTHLDTARRVILEGIAAAVGQTVDGFRLTNVQGRALQALGACYLRRDGRGFVITGNTGSGKTEAALLPLLVGAARERMEGVIGCKVLLVYPRQALVRNQLDRIVRYLARVNERIAATPSRGVSGTSLTVGILYGETPEDDGDLADGSRYRRGWERVGDGTFILPYFPTEDGFPILAVRCSEGVYTLRPSGGSEGWQLDGFRATRQSILETPPDVLVLTTEMLHRWLLDPNASRLFGVSPDPGRAAPFCPPRAVMFDEIHLYDTVHGAQIGMLLRRLRNRLFHALRAEQAGWVYPLVIGMSATIGNPVAYWMRLSGVPIVDGIEPERADLGAAQGRDYFLFIRPETYSRGKRVGDASAAIQVVMAVAHNMARRSASADEPPKHRSLVFLDSISKVRKLAVEFRDAETRRHLAQYRLTRPAGGIGSAQFDDGEYWYFDEADPRQSSERRNPGQPPARLTSDPQPVYSATGRAAIGILQRDVIFATTALEVGYDDPSIQFVLQHHAPRTPANFVQKRGRAGRSPDDRPITVITLSGHQYKDAFYYQNPGRLSEPTDYVPALNVDNYFVQRYQVLALIFDELARVTGRDYARLRPGEGLTAHLDRVEGAIALEVVARALGSAYPLVACDAFRRVHPDWRAVWRWFRGRVADLGTPAQNARTLLEVCPDLPRNLFGTINLPTVRVGFNKAAGRGNAEWVEEEEDIALVFGELAPGRVSRRYGPPGRHLLFWLPPFAWPLVGAGCIPRAVAAERCKRRNDRVGPFDPARLQPAAWAWGPDWQQFLPDRLRLLYGSDLPDRFYRIRYLELHNFGTIDPDNPRRPQPDWRWAAARRRDGGVAIRFDGDGGFRRQDATARLLSPDSNSTPLAFTVVRAWDPDAGATTMPQASIPVPPLFPGLADRLDCFSGEVDGARSVLHVYEVQYGAEAALQLIPQGPNDRAAGTVHLDVRYISEHDGRPTLYGHDLTTEGVRLSYDPDRVADLADRLWDHLRHDDATCTHAQDQFFRYLLKSRPWPADGVSEPLTPYEARTVAELLATARAESRARGQSVAAFLDSVATPAGLRGLIADYWRDHRLFADPDFTARLFGTLTGPRARAFLSEAFDRVRTDFRQYLADVVLHSLERGLRNLFLIEGSTRDEEVGTHGPLYLTHGRRPSDPAIYVYERNQDGNGATRLLADFLGRHGRGYSLGRWWASTLGCPVGDEEDLVKYLLRAHAGELAAFRAAFEAAPPSARPSPREPLERLTEGWRLAALDDPSLGRLAGILTGELTFAGERVPQLGLVTELLGLDDELTRRFGRPPTPAELAGFAATRAERTPAAVPHVRLLYDIYQRHAADLGADPDDESEPANPLDRFLAQVEHLSLSTCVEACPACLAGQSPHGPLEVTRHLISRRLLAMAHRLLTSEFTRPLDGSTPDGLIEVARRHDWLVVETDRRPPGDLTRAMRHAGLNQVGEFVEYRSGAAPLIRGMWTREDGS